MPTTLTATYSAGTLTDPPRVLLAVTGAPSLTPPYTSNFATVDGWTIAGTGTVTALTYAGRPSLRMVSSPDADTLASRTVTGLTIGQQYRWGVYLTAVTGKVSLGVQGKAFGGAKQPVGGSRNFAAAPTFTATATSHVIQVSLKPNTTGGTDYADYYLDTGSVVRTSGWLGTTITRTDTNGTHPVRVPDGLDTVGTSGSATMTVTDYEAALHGPLSYTVTDGSGGTDTETVTAPTDPGVWLTLPATSNPVTSTPPGFAPAAMVTGLTESSQSNGSLHTIIGRADPIANPGPLALRAGTMDLWCPDYASAAAVRSLLADGDVAHLRQPTYPGLDAYLVAREVRIVPEEPTGTQRWVASLTYQEVSAP